MEYAIITSLIVVIIVQLCIAVVQNDRNRALKEANRRLARRTESCISEVRRARIAIADYHDRLGEMNEWSEILED